VQHTDDRRDIVTQNVKLEQPPAYRIIIEMRGDDIGFRFIRRALYGAELVYAVSLRQDHKPAGMLPGRAFYAHAAGYQPVYFGVSMVLSTFIEIFFNEPKGGFIRQCADRARLKHITRAEHFFNISVRARLIFAREIKVDIRFFIAVEPKEGFKRDIVPVFLEIRAAVANAVRHVVAGRAGVSARGMKIRIFALGADIMRRQRVYLGYPEHSRHK
jgi:hypothetical protein